MANYPPSPSGPRPPDPPSRTSYELELERLTAKFEELRALEASGRRRMLVGALVLLVVPLALLGVAYHQVTTNFAPAAMQQAMARELPQMLPELAGHLARAGHDAFPTYQKIAAERLPVVGPKFVERCTEQATRLQQDLDAELRTRTATLYTHVVKRLDPEFRSLAPSVPDDRRQAIVEEFRRQVIDSEGQRIAKRIEAFRVAEAGRYEILQAKLAGTIGNSPTGVDRTRVERQFLHNLLQWADLELTTGSPVSEEEIVPPERTARPGQLVIKSKPAGAPALANDHR